MVTKTKQRIKLGCWVRQAQWLLSLAVGLGGDLWEGCPGEGISELRPQAPDRRETKGKGPAGRSSGSIKTKMKP